MAFLKKRRYELHQVIGEGGFSQVWRATDRVTGLDVAVKVSPRSADSLTKHEMHIGADLDHPHVVRMLDAFKTRKHYYLVFELLQGKELFDQIVGPHRAMLGPRLTRPQIDRGRFPKHAARETTRALVQAVHYLHVHGVIHRDLKPENIVYRHPHSPPDDFVVCDFGLSARVSLYDPDDFVEGQVGSPGYVSPETLDGQGTGRPSDIWAVGLVVYAMLTGRTPFTASEEDALLKECWRAEITYPEVHWSAVPEEAVDFVRGCLVRDPAGRMTAAEALEHPVRGMNGRRCIAGS
jgi:calcium/calmodulin-dependent protein kinase I